MRERTKLRKIEENDNRKGTRGEQEKRNRRELGGEKDRGGSQGGGKR